MTAAALQRQLRALVAAELELADDAIDAQAPLSRYGLDSLATAGLTVALEHELGVVLPPGLLHGSLSVEALARLLAADHPAPPEQALARMLADACLPADVVPAEIVPAGAVDACRGPGAVLLTGATGFLGAYLLDALLRETDAPVHCLVRAESREDGLRRVHRNLRRYGLGANIDPDRLVVVLGDLERPRLGLEPGAYRRLAGELCAVYHAAAAVDWIHAYPALRQANVAGTSELLRLACLERRSTFHFVSSLSVCYSTTGPEKVCEQHEMLPWLAGMHLGYAQSKCVAESLVQQAAVRGLPATIHRPAFITGDSRTGASNTEDFIAALLKGCIQLGYAPDLDWTLEAVPVDHAAAAIVALAAGDAEGARTFHLTTPRPRHWRECVLWMRIYGYPLRLEPYAAWLRRLRREGLAEGHALRPLLPFFLGRHGPDAHTLPELYEQNRRGHAAAHETERALAERSLRTPSIDPAMLERYFDRFVADGFLAAPPAGCSARPAKSGSCPAAGPGTDPVPQLLQQALSRTPVGRTAAAEGAALQLVSRVGVPIGGDASIVAELTSWRSRRATGLYRYTLGYVRSAEAVGVTPARVDVVLKIKPSDETVLDVAVELARLCDDAVGAAFARFRHRIGFTGCHQRELAIYGQSDERFRRHSPALLAAHRDDAKGEWMLVLEDLHDVALIDASGGTAAWGETEIEAALGGLAELHAIWYGREQELRGRGWLGPVQTSAGMAEMRPLWQALAAHAAPLFGRHAGARLPAVHAQLAASAGGWWQPLERQPRTLIHNDFNSRNIALRRDPDRGRLRLVAYDWELSTLGAPQRDLAEFLCFVLPPTAAARADRYVEQYRRLLESATGATVERGLWQQGFRAALGDLLVNRLAMYALVERCRPQRFLPRVLRSWLALYDAQPAPLWKERE